MLLWRRYLVGLGDLTDDLAGGRVDGGEGFPVDGVLPFIVDEELDKRRPACIIKSQVCKAFAACFIKGRFNGQIAKNQSVGVHTNTTSSLSGRL